MSYVYSKPEIRGPGADHMGALEYKHAWVVSHDRLLFASGWYVSADEYPKFVMDEAIARYHAEGRGETLAYYNNPKSVDAQWYVFVATPDGEILGHYNADELGAHLEEMLDASRNFIPVGSEEGDDAQPNKNGAQDRQPHDESLPPPGRLVAGGIRRVAGQYRLALFGCDRSVLLPHFDFLPQPGKESWARVFRGTHQ